MSLRRPARPNEGASRLQKSTPWLALVISVVSLIVVIRNSDRQLSASERAWITIRTTQIRNDSLTVGAHPVVIVEYHNTGYSPALHLVALSSSWFREAIPGGNEFPYDVLRRDAGGNQLDPPSTSTLGPNTTQYVVAPLKQTFSSDTLADLQANRLAIFIYGVIDYDDIFHEHHVTTFCHMTMGASLMTPDTVSMGSCPKWNDAD